MIVLKDRNSLVFFLGSQLFILLFATCLILPFTISAQDDDLPEGVAPAATKDLSKDEKKLLEAESSNTKKRTKISLQLMEARITSAEKSHAINSYQASLNDLAGFHAILDNILGFLLKTDANDRRFIDFEIYLRKQIPRLETIRREMPYKYSYHVGKLMKAVREARAKAVEPIFENTVVPTAIKKPE